MPDTTCHMSISLDGFVAGPTRAARIHSERAGAPWLAPRRRARERADATAAAPAHAPRGAYVMGRNMFGPIRGEWDQDWRGWWGSDPPYHAPVFVLTHHAREPIEMEGGTTFHFVTGGFDAAYAQARETAGEDIIDIAGGASTVRQALVAGVDRRAHARPRPRPARLRRAALRLSPVPRVRAHRGTPFSASHTHPATGGRVLSATRRGLRHPGDPRASASREEPFSDKSSLQISFPRIHRWR